ncbi:MAG: hypothetical protein R3B07_07085 [Polyangiaceae bacterium]
MPDWQMTSQCLAPAGGRVLHKAERLGRVWIVIHLGIELVEERIPRDWLELHDNPFPPMELGELLPGRPPYTGDESLVDMRFDFEETFEESLYVFSRHNPVQLRSLTFSAGNHAGWLQCEGRMTLDFQFELGLGEVEWDFATEVEVMSYEAFEDL